MTPFPSAVFTHPTQTLSRSLRVLVARNSPKPSIIEQHCTAQSPRDVGMSRLRKDVQGCQQTHIQVGDGLLGLTVECHTL